MDLGLRGKVTVITGANSGIGLATAKLFAMEGAKVVMVARRKEVLDRALADVSQHGEAEAIALDITSSAGQVAMLEDVAARHGRLDILVNNAGAGEFAPIESMSDEMFHSAFQLSVDAPFVAMRCVFPIMERNGGGAIINVSSVSGVRAQAFAASHGSSRAALNLLSSVAAIEGAPKGIRVNALQVGPVMTEGTEGYAREFPEMVAKVAQSTPAGRWGKPEEVASCIAFLASERASFVVGGLLAVDGGQGIQFPF